MKIKATVRNGDGKCGGKRNSNFLYFRFGNFDRKRVVATAYDRRISFLIFDSQLA